MNDLRKGRWSDPGTAINEPEDAWLQEHPLLAKDLRRISASHSRNVINDYQSLNQRLGAMSKRMQITLLRGGLLAGYILAAVFLIVFFSAAGDGSYAPGAVLLGWGIVPWQLRIVPGAVGFLLVPAVYLMCFFAAVSLFARSLLPAGIHAVGIVIAVLNVKHGHLAVGGWLMMSYVLSLLVALSYLWCDQRLVRRPQHHPVQATAAPSRN